MASDRSIRHDGSVRGRRAGPPRPQTGRDLEQQVIKVERSGYWLPAEELREAALAALLQGKGVILNLDGIDHLDASALQILLALDAAERKLGRNLQLVKASSQLRKWFEFAGVDGRLSINEQRKDALNCP